MLDRNLKTHTLLALLGGCAKIAQKIEYYKPYYTDLMKKLEKELQLRGVSQKRIDLHKNG
jgi:hypothetical protein